MDWFYVKIFALIKVLEARILLRQLISYIDRANNNVFISFLLAKKIIVLKRFAIRHFRRVLDSWNSEKVNLCLDVDNEKEKRKETLKTIFLYIILYQENSTSLKRFDNIRVSIIKLFHQ